MIRLSDGRRLDELNANKALRRRTAHLPLHATYERIYTNDLEMIADLGKVYAPRVGCPKEGMGMLDPFAYQKIYCLALNVQRGFMLSNHDIQIARSLALEIKKAAIISEFILSV